jgi:hypothetical protein
MNSAATYSLLAAEASSLGNGRVSSQSERAAASGSILWFRHHDSSFPER